MFKNNKNIKFVESIKNYEIDKSDFFAEILGEHCEVEYTFYNEISVKLQFPYYFGRNFIALEECINDFEWFEDVDNLYYDKFIIYINNPEKILIKEDIKYRKAFFRILQELYNNKVLIIFENKDYDYLKQFEILQK